MSRQVFEWRVTGQDLKSVTVKASTRLQAVQEAARTWGVPWTSIARKVTVEKLGEVVV